MVDQANPFLARPRRDQPRKTSKACHAAAVFGILAVFFGALALLFPFPENFNMENNIKDKILIKQSQVDQWGAIPGSLGYKMNKDVQVNYLVKEQNGPTCSTQDGQSTIQPTASDKLTFNMNRTFANATYRPTESIIDYSEHYGYNSDAMNWDADETITTPNFAVLSAWKQSMGKGRANFVKAFQGMTQMKKLIVSADMYGRFLAYNLFHYGFKEKETMQAFTGVDDEMAEAIFNDTKYGLDSINGMYRWVRAYRSTEKSKKEYNDALAYFQNKFGADKFTDKHMQAWVGPKSMINFMNNTMGTRMGFFFNYPGRVADETIMVGDQWGQRRITKNQEIIVFDDPKIPPLTSMADLFTDKNSGKIPNNLVLPIGFKPELNYYLEEVLNLPSEFVAIENYGVSLAYLSEDPLEQKTLLSLPGMQFFFERYVLADFEAIRQRFLTKGMQSPLTNDQIIGLYNYFNAVADKFVEKGPDDAEEWSTYQAIGSWLSLTVKTSYNQVYEIVKNWVNTRYLAAKVLIDDKNCTDYVDVGIQNMTRSQEICHDFDFTQANMSGIYYFANAQTDQDVKAELLKKTNMTTAEYSKVFSTDPNSIATQLTGIAATLAKTYQCKSSTACTIDELAMAQYVNGSLTDWAQQPEEYRGNTFLGGSSLSVSVSWQNNTIDRPIDNDGFFFPELKNYIGKDVKIQKASAESLLTDESTSLTNKWRAALIANYTYGFEQNAENAALINGIYQTDDFYGLFDSMRNMIQSYLFNGTSYITLTKKEYLFGYHDKRIERVFNNTADYLDGMEVDMQSFITPVFTDKSPQSMSQHFGIYPGTISVDNIARVREMNDKDYLNREQRMWNGQNFTDLQVTPEGTYNMFKQATNGMQFSPQVARNSSELSIMNPSVLQIQKYTQDGDTQNLDDDHKKIQVKVFKTNDFDNSAAGTLLQNLDVTQMVSNQAIKVQPETGILMSKSETIESKLNIHGFAKAGKQNGDKMFFPMPDLDQYAGQQFLLSSTQTTLDIDPVKYEDDFDFVHGKKEIMASTRLYFGIAGGACLVLFIISAICACRSAKAEQQDVNNLAAI